MPLPSQLLLMRPSQLPLKEAKRSPLSNLKSAIRLVRKEAELQAPAMIGGMESEIREVETGETGTETIGTTEVEMTDAVIIVMIGIEMITGKFLEKRGSTYCELIDIFVAGVTIDVGRGILLSTMKGLDLPCVVPVLSKPIAAISPAID